MKESICVPRILTPSQIDLSNRRSLEINPANAEHARQVESLVRGRRGGERRLALAVGFRWPETGQVLSVNFMDTRSTALKKRILQHLNAWNKTANIIFKETSGTGMVRITRMDEQDSEDLYGFWSYLGTQILGIEEDQPTMNLESFTMKTPESEYRRVVRHEAGHTLGFEHEHMRKELVERIDHKKAVAFYKKDQGWDEKDTKEQVLTPLSARSIMGTTEADPESIMCYQVPGKITKDGKPIVGGEDINENDYAFAAKVYPKDGARGRSASASRPDSPAVDRQAAAPVEAPHDPPASAMRLSLPPAAGEMQLVILDEFDPDGELKDFRTAAKKELKSKFVRIFATYDGASVSWPMRVRKEVDGEPTNFGQIIGIHKRIKNYTNRNSGTLPDDAEMVKFGGLLFDTLFQGDVRRLYDEARVRCGGGKLGFVITSMIPWIADKPWEFAYDTSRGKFLATEEIHLLRNVLTSVPAELIPPRPGPLRILVASALPVGAGRLSIEQEVEVIRRGFEPLVEAGLVKVEVLARTTPGRIHDTLAKDTFDVVHFIGHGGYDEGGALGENKGEDGIPQKEKGGYLLFENEQGYPVKLYERSAREIFCKRGVRLVFLNACETGRGGLADFNRGIAQSLVSHGLPALVANQYSVLDFSATTFARNFYWALSQGMNIGKAACEARIAVNYSMNGDPIDWAVPVVYARDSRMTLCEKPAEATPALASGVRRSDRHAIKTRPLRIAVWDMDNSFPDLHATLEEMNDAQNVFGLELVSLSMPLDVWYLEERAGDGTPYLWAEKLRERMSKVIMELRVSSLVCITRHWLCDNDTLNIYSSWPFSGEGAPISIFSTAGLDIPPAGDETNRAIANVIVGLFAGFLGHLESHGGSKNCPMFYNESRDLAFLTGRQNFDARCLASLKERLGPDQANVTGALEALLATFH